LPFVGVAVLDFFAAMVIIICICLFQFGEVIDEEELRVLHNYSTGDQALKIKSKCEENDSTLSVSNVSKFV
jgi:hypothetical protein